MLNQPTPQYGIIRGEKKLPKVVEGLATHRAVEFQRLSISR